MKVKFYGVRGSIPTPGKGTVKYGGNTSCVLVEADEELVILDGGSGLRVLGMELMGRIFSGGAPNQLEMYLFFSHVHWDHIQGIPFFEPLFIKGQKVHMFGEKKAQTCLEDVLKGQQQYPNFPISVEEVSINGASLDFKDLCAGEEVAVSGNVYVDCVKLSHPDGVFSYKVTETNTGKKVVYATDTEHRDVIDPRIVSFCKGDKNESPANILIYDSQYTPDEYCGKVGIPKIDWGHSTYVWGVNTAIAAEVETLVLFHHEPKHDDKAIDDILKAAKELADGRVKVVAAQEGAEIEI